MRSPTTSHISKLFHYVGPEIQHFFHKNQGFGQGVGTNDYILFTLVHAIGCLSKLDLLPSYLIRLGINANSHEEQGLHLIGVT